MGARNYQEMENTLIRTRYRDFIESRFLIDDPRSGKLVPFKFRPIQEKYYNELVKDYDIEHKGLTAPIREIVLKARREGFSSFILALFAADDILSTTPTETLLISYKDDATSVFRKRYKLFITSAAAIRHGLKQGGQIDEIVRQIQERPAVLQMFAKKIFSQDATEFEIADNRAHFYCGTASARVGGRGGTVQKLLFSEAAFYPDKKELRASEIVEGTMRQVDPSAGWVFIESTANGDASENYYARIWDESKAGSRFKHRFYGWREFYTPEQFELIKSEFTDKRMIPQEYPETPEEAFMSSGDRFFDTKVANAIKTERPMTEAGGWKHYGVVQAGHRIAGGADVSEGVGRHSSTIAIIDFDAKKEINGMVITKPRVVSVYASNKIAPDLFAHEVKSGGQRFGNCLMCPERNNHGYATLAVLQGIYDNIWRDEHGKLGWHTNMATKPRMMHELRTAIHEDLLDISDEALKREIISYPAYDLNENNRDEEDESMGHYDRTIALAIAWAMRIHATPIRSFENLGLENERRRAARVKADAGL